MMDLNLFTSFIFGVMSYISPCVLPLIPAYVFYITGLKADQDKEDKIQYISKILTFITGFTLVFILLGTIAGILSFFINNFNDKITTEKLIKGIINKVLGGIIIVFSFHFFGIFNFMFLNSEKRFHFNKIPSGYLGSFLFGMAFAAGWSPCVGPFLGTVFGMATMSGTFVKSIFLLLFYSLGLALPLLLTATFFNFFSPIIDFLKRHSEGIKKISGVFLFLIGILIFFGILSNVNMYVGKFAYFLEDHKTAGNIIFSLLLIIIGFLFILPMILKKKMMIGLLITYTILTTAGILGLFNILPIIDYILKYLTYSGV